MPHFPRACLTSKVKGIQWQKTGYKAQSFSPRQASQNAMLILPTAILGTGHMQKLSVCQLPLDRTDKQQLGPKAPPLPEMHNFTYTCST